MEVINKHFGVFDFWSVFGCGIVCFTSFVVGYNNVFVNVDLTNFPWFLYVVIAYVIGLVLHSASSLLVDCGIARLSAEQLSNDKFEEKWLFHRYYKKYYENNTLIDDETKDIGFQKCYNDLKHCGITYRIDKLHVLYSMMRGISFGYSVLSVISFWNIFDPFADMSIKQNAIILIVYLTLTIAFYCMTKKYFYRWIEWVFIEYQYKKIEEEK